MSEVAVPVAAAPRRFCLVLVKPSHHGDDGYPHRLDEIGDSLQFARLHARHRPALRRAECAAPVEAEPQSARIETAE